MAGARVSSLVRCDLMWSDAVISHTALSTVWRNPLMMFDAWVGGVAPRCLRKYSGRWPLVTAATGRWWSLTVAVGRWCCCGLWALVTAPVGKPDQKRGIHEYVWRQCSIIVFHKVPMFGFGPAVVCTRKKHNYLQEIYFIKNQN